MVVVQLVMAARARHLLLGGLMPLGVDCGRAVPFPISRRLLKLVVDASPGALAQNRWLGGATAGC